MMRSRRPDAAARYLSVLRYAKWALLLIIATYLTLASRPRSVQLWVDDANRARVLGGAGVAHATEAIGREGASFDGFWEEGGSSDEAQDRIGKNDEVPSSSPGSSRPSRGEWKPEAYLRRALAGPRRCLGAPCYIVDVVADPFQPRLFLSMLGLPATNIPRHRRGGLQNVTMIDVRSGEEMVMAQSYTLGNKTHGLGLLLTGGGNGTILVHCKDLKHQRATALNSYYESQTHACDLSGSLDLAAFDGGRPIRVDVVLAPLASTGDNGGPYGRLNLNGEERPFHISSDGRLSEGLLNSISRRSPPIPLSWKSPPEYPASTDKLTVSACLIGVDYNSPQQREVVQHYVTMGFAHVYLGLNQWPTSEAFAETWRSLRDFVEDGSLSILISEYASAPIEPEKFGDNFSYAPQAHKSSFVNTCLLAARAAGDDATGVFDIDEIIEHDYGNATSIGEVLADQLRLRNLTLRDTCSINMGSVSAFYSNETAGPRANGRIADKIDALAAGTDSVNKYGKSFHNVRRVLRAGLHGVAYCESLPEPGTPADKTLPSDWMPRKGDPDVKPSNENYVENNWRASREPPRALRTLHLSDSYRWRSELKLESSRRQSQTSYYARDWSGLVHADLDRREGTGGNNGVK